jgi:hypothetical protein
VQGILHWAKEEGGRITSLDRATREEDTLSLGAFLFLELQSILRGVAIVSGSIVLAYLLYSLLEIIIIYTFIPNWFSPGGFIQGHVDQKSLCPFSCMLRCVVQHFIVKI